MTIARAALTLTYPARFAMIAAMNPCPCGHFGDSARPCRCAPHEIYRYRGKVSGPLLDRIDIQIEVPSVPFGDFRGEAKAEGSAVVAERVKVARLRQQKRFRSGRTRINGAMAFRQVRRHCRLDDEGETLLRAAYDRLALSARGMTRVLKVARTIADLAGWNRVAADDIAEAIQYRSLDRGLV